MTGLRKGDRILWQGRHAGTVAYVGRVHFAPDEFIGVALDQAVGGGDGAWHGRRYFSCPRGHGALLRDAEVMKVG
eukprot:CAMPEP_0198420498 /NCGR_PEP_ID=MMETSP1452-20131203/951_1 /TAXON_ID=1181717 /ORGANISM="Synchroma pusillum, Strain CCMP3072" /LENGTH=74 /DNA_ID=CAMNT_0044140661 /DNA_START=32 /DNA_END=256 /DNA_ORIENTATION=+